MNDLIVFNKPYGVICQFTPHEKHGCLKDYIAEPDFYPAGRLDTDSEGLLLLTNNGRLQAQIADPKYKKRKRIGRRWKVCLMRPNWICCAQV